VRYFLISNDARREERWERELDDRGFDVTDEYDPDAIVVTLGGDGTILYAARTHPDPTILPVRAGDSVGERTHLETDQVLDALDRLERDGIDRSAVVEHRKLAAYRDGDQLRGGFDALNEISLHHSSPVLAAVFSLRIRDRGECHEFERVIGDGVVVSTAFGSTGYYRAITGGRFFEGVGVALNNVHTPVDAPSYAVLSADGVVGIELLESEHASSAILTRDNDDETYELTVGESIQIRQSEASIGILRPALPGE